MMTDVACAVIVGGGIGGMAAAIRLREQGAAVSLIELDPDWRVYGAGITITGPTLRAFGRLGVLGEISARGAISRSTRFRLSNGTILREFEEPALEDGLPGTGGILRPILHDILARRVRALGTDVRLGVTVERVEQHNDRAMVRLTDGTALAADLVVAADGIHSTLRRAHFAHAVAPAYTGQGVWRVLARRDPSLDAVEFYVGGRGTVGVVPCSAEQVYAFIVSHEPARVRVPAEAQPDHVRALLAGYGGNVAAIRDEIADATAIVHRPLESALQPKPWHEGRVVLLGDAAHATTPHLASGAGLAVEDALVLAECLAGGGSLAERLASWAERRYERCRAVVETSWRIGEMQIAGADFAEIGKLMGAALHALMAEP